MYYLALIFGKLVDWSITTFHLGAGSTWPGEVALRIDPQFILHSLKHQSTKVILVAGTNGKTTTSLLIREGLKKAGKRVIHNAEGANLLNGVASSLIQESPFNGKLYTDYCVFELDENAFPQVLTQINAPFAVALLNLFRDQLDRYGEVHAISARWAKALYRLPKETQFIVNGDDPRLAFIENKRDIFYFGADEKDKQIKQIPHDVDSTYCPQCGSKLSYSAMSYSHLGDFTCSNCSFKSPKKWTEKIPSLLHLSGVYNRYNVRAAVALLHRVLEIPLKDAFHLVENVGPAFGRQERFTAWGKKWIAILSKNPSGFNQSIDSLREILGTSKTTVCLILNDRIPDGTDVSWIWDVDFEHIFYSAEKVVTTGDRTYDMAIRMETASGGSEAKKSILSAETDVKKALELCAQNHAAEVPIVILATYTGMLQARKLLVGKALL